MSDLLPANATPLERAMSEALARISDVPVAVRSVWSADDCPLAVLPWLAWAFSVDDWDASWTEEQKRATVQRAIAVQKKKGTIGAVKTALAALGITATVQEWFAQIPAGTPYTFRLLLESSQSPVTQQGIAAALAVVNSTKNLRSHLDEITVSARSESRVYVGVVAAVGSEITVTGFIPGQMVVDEFDFNLG